MEKVQKIQRPPHGPMTQVSFDLRGVGPLLQDETLIIQVPMIEFPEEFGEAANEIARQSGLNQSLVFETMAEAIRKLTVGKFLTDRLL